MAPHTSNDDTANHEFYTFYKSIGGSVSKATTSTLKILILFVFLGGLFGITPAHADTKRIVVLGDSLTSGYGLEGGQAFPEQLQKFLIAEGHDVKVENAGVAGDTSAGGLARLEWSIAGDKQPDLVIVALGGNDMLRGLDAAMTKENISRILSQLKEKNIAVLLAGMKAQTQYSAPYQEQFNKIYPDVAKQYQAKLYPFFLEGVALNADFNQPDGIHPNTKGIDEMIKRMAPTVKSLL